MKPLELLDAMAETWVDKENIIKNILAIPVNCSNKEHQERAHALILRLVKQAYVEGLYTGSTGAIKELKERQSE